MSLPWNKTACFVMDMHQVTGRIGSAKAPGAEVAIPVFLPSEAAAPYASLEVALVDAITALAQDPERKFRYLDIEIADVFSYFEVINIDARRFQRGELQRIATLDMADMLGLAAEHLVVRCSVQKGGLSIVACAMPLALTETIRTTVERLGYRINRFEPSFAAFWNKRCVATRVQDALFVQVRPASVLFGWLSNGRWLALSLESIRGIEWIQLRDYCDAFCARVCIPNRDTVPILYDAPLEGMPEEMSIRWQPLPPARLAA